MGNSQSVKKQNLPDNSKMIVKFKTYINAILKHRRNLWILSYPGSDESIKQYTEEINQHISNASGSTNVPINDVKFPDMLRICELYKRLKNSRYDLPYEITNVRPTNLPRLSQILKDNCISHITEYTKAYNKQCIMIEYILNHMLACLSNIGTSHTYDIGDYNDFVQATFKDTNYFTCPYFRDKWENIEINLGRIKQAKTDLQALRNSNTALVMVMMGEINSYKLPELNKNTQIPMPDFLSCVFLFNAEMDKLLKTYNYIGERGDNKVYKPIQDYMDYIELIIHIANIIKDNVDNPADLDKYEEAIRPTRIKYEKDYQPFDIKYEYKDKKYTMSTEYNNDICQYVNLMTNLNTSQLAYLELYKKMLFPNSDTMKITDCTKIYLDYFNATFIAIRPTK